MITALLFATAVLSPSDGGPLMCPVMGHPIKATAPAVEYNGIYFGTCCAGCNTEFSKDPQKYMKMAAEKNMVIGLTMFDPVTGNRVKDSKITTDYKGIRYAFSSEDNQKAFLKDEAKYSKLPSKVEMTCPVTGEKVDAYSASAGYVDYHGVRYFACCGDCLPSMHKDMATLSKKVADKVTHAVAIEAKKG